MSDFDIPLVGVSTVPDAGTREEYLGREANLRGIGALLYLQAVWLGFLGSAWVYLGVTGEQPSQVAAVSIALGVFALLLAPWLWVGAKKLRRLERGGLWQGRVSGLLCLFGYPIGTLIGIGIFYITFGERADFVLTQEYRDLVERTPDIQAKWSPITKILIYLLAIVLTLVAVFFLAALLMEGTDAFTQK